TLSSIKLSAHIKKEDFSCQESMTMFISFTKNKEFKHIIYFAKSSHFLNDQSEKTAHQQLLDHYNTFDGGSYGNKQSCLVIGGAINLKTRKVAFTSGTLNSVWNGSRKPFA